MALVSMVFTTGRKKRKKHRKKRWRKIRGKWEDKRKRDSYTRLLYILEVVQLLFSSAKIWLNLWKTYLANCSFCFTMAKSIFFWPQFWTPECFAMIDTSMENRFLCLLFCDQLEVILPWTLLHLSYKKYLPNTFLKVLFH